MWIFFIQEITEKVYPKTRLILKYLSCHRKQGYEKDFPG